MPANNFKSRVISVVAQIPKGRVMTYGQIAVICGNPRAARIVGGIAHFGDPDLPWQRVVNKHGGLARGYPGGLEGHGKALKAEGVRIDNYLCKDLDKILWKPNI